MDTVKLMVHISKPLKAKLDAIRAEGTTASGLIRRLLNEFFNNQPPKPHRRTPQ